MTANTKAPAAQPLAQADAQLLAQLVQLGLQKLAEDASRILNTLPVEPPPPPGD